MIYWIWFKRHSRSWQNSHIMGLMWVRMQLFVIQKYCIPNTHIWFLLILVHLFTEVITLLKWTTKTAAFTTMRTQKSAIFNFQSKRMLRGWWVQHGFLRRHPWTESFFNPTPIREDGCSHCSRPVLGHRRHIPRLRESRVLSGQYISNLRVFSLQEFRRKKDKEPQRLLKLD